MADANAKLLAMNDSEFNAITKIEEGKLQRDRFIELSRDQPISIMRGTKSTFCPKCKKPVELLTFSRSAGLFKTDDQDIEFLAKRGDLHRLHNRNGELLICSNSLFDCFDTRKTRLLDSHFEIEMHRSFGAKLEG